MVETQEDENSLFEYFIVGLVILSFGGLYYFINHSGGDGVGQPVYAVSSSNQFESATEDLKTSGIVIPDSSDGSDAKQLTDNKVEAATTQTVEDAEADKATKLAAFEAEKQKAVEANQQAIEALAAEKSKLLNEVAVLRSDREELLATNNELIEEAQTVVKQLAATKQAAALVPQQQALAQPQATETGDAWVVRYQLPDGTAVNVADQGFEGLLKQALEAKALNKPIVFDSIYFESGASEPTKNSQQQIIATAALMNAHQDRQILIKGHTDNTGDPRKNTLLSLSRSSYMKNALVNLGIDTRRINVQGVGSLESIASNDTEDGRNSNRRIELIIIK
jgi:outer membrane protein OmpA-like peptidoglycan-associated protein